MKTAVATTFPSIDPARCTGCQTCVATCPQGALVEPFNIRCAKCVKYCSSLEVECRREKPVVLVEHCDACGLCLPACPTGAMAWSTG